MTSTIGQSVIDRLTKLLGMLGSAHDGERGVAAAKADELVLSRGLTWSDVVARPQPASAPRRSSSKGWREPETIREKIDVALRYRGLLNAWEASFLIDVKRFRHPSPKQRACIERIYRRVRAAALTPNI